jgi:predicted CopG family antitoxin
MKTINESFTDEEFERLKRKKGKRSWHDFIMSLALEAED